MSIDVPAILTIGGSLILYSWTALHFLHVEPPKILKWRTKKPVVDPIQDMALWKKQRRREDELEWALAWHRIEPVNSVTEYPPIANNSVMRERYEQFHIVNAITQRVNRLIQPAAPPIKKPSATDYATGATMIVSHDGRVIAQF